MAFLQPLSHQAGADLGESAAVTLQLPLPWVCPCCRVDPGIPRGLTHTSQAYPVVHTLLSD